MYFIILWRCLWCGVRVKCIAFPVVHPFEALVGQFLHCLEYLNFLFFRVSGLVSIPKESLCVFYNIEYNYKERDDGKFVRGVELLRRSRNHSLGMYTQGSLKET